MPRQNGIGIDVGQYDHAKLCAFLDRFQRLDGVGQKIAGVRVYLNLEPIEACRLSDLRDAHCLGRVSRAGCVEHHFHSAAVDCLQYVVAGRISFMDARKGDRDELRLACGKRGFCLLTRRELARSEEEAVGEHFLSNDQWFHSVSPFRFPCPAEARQRRWPPSRRRFPRAD